MSIETGIEIRIKIKITKQKSESPGTLPTVFFPLVISLKNRFIVPIYGSSALALPEIH